ncbi:MAG TPA: hypothetical protein PLV31_03505 [Gammaproteobacteria bacterium]|mgnify:CR=1 FL=1|nr:hypothetical protein [Gammaproteobacteria bacterium]
MFYLFTSEPTMGERIQNAANAGIQTAASIAGGIATVAGAATAVGVPVLTAAATVPVAIPVIFSTIVLAPSIVSARQAYENTPRHPACVLL